MATLGPVSASVNLYSLWASIYRQEAWESKSRVVAIKKFREPRRQRSLLLRDRWVCSLCPAPQLEAWTEMALPTQGGGLA